MRSKLFSFKRGFIIQDLRNIGWIGLVYFVCLLFSVPLQLIMSASRSERHYPFYDEAKSLFAVLEGFQTILLFTIPVLVAIFLFRYMQVKLSADYIHSLPIRRAALYNQHIVVGMAVLLVPVLVTGIVLFLVGEFFIVDRFQELLSIPSIAKWMAITALVNLFVFFAGVFVGMFTGMSALQGVLVYLMFVFPVGITMLFSINLEYYLFGFAVDYYLSTNLEKIIPFVRVAEFAHQSLFTWIEVVSYGLLTLLFYLIGLFIYKKRNVEAATQAISFKLMQPIFKYGIVFCAMLLGGMYFGETQDEIGWIIFGYFVASLIGYFVAEMLLQKTWRVFTKWKGYTIFAMVIVVIGFLLQMDITGYEKNIPELSEVERIYFAESIYYMEEKNEEADRYSIAVPGSDFLTPTYFYQEDQNKSIIRDLHKQIVQDKDIMNDTTTETRHVVIGYELKDGEKVVRKYDIPFEQYKQFYRPIVESVEHKTNQYPLLRIDDLSGVEKVSVYTHRLNKRVSITDPQKIAEFYTILQAEMLAETFEHTYDNREAWAEIEFRWNDNKMLHASWKKSYEQIEQWLDQNGLLEQARVTADDVNYAVVIQNTEGKELYEFMRKFEQEGANLEDLEGALKITDDKQINEALRRVSWKSEPAPFVIAFYYEGEGYPEFQTFTVDQLPSFLR